MRAMGRGGVPSSVVPTTSRGEPARHHGPMGALRLGALLGARRMHRARLRFDGRIAGVGSSSGVRVVVGSWSDSPLGDFADVMVERADGHRILLAPSAEVAEFVSQTYTFDEVRVEAVEVEEGDTEWVVTTDSLSLSLTLGGRMPLGRLLRLVPRPLATAPAWTRVTDPVARRVMRGVRTRGQARAGRREFYAATDLRAVTAMEGRLDGIRLGALAPVDPPCRFGFGSTPRTPSVTTLVTTVVETG